MQWNITGNIFLLDWLSATPFPQISSLCNFTNISVSTREEAEYTAEQEEKVSVPFFLIVHVLDWVTMEPQPQIPQYENLFFQWNTNTQWTYYIPQLTVVRQDSDCTKEWQEKTKVSECQWLKKKYNYTVWFSMKVSASKMVSLQVPNQSFTYPNQLLPRLSEKTGTPCAQLQLQSTAYQRIPFKDINL